MRGLLTDAGGLQERYSLWNFDSINLHYKKDHYAFEKFNVRYKESYKFSSLTLGFPFFVYVGGMATSEEATFWSSTSTLG